tara:strand:- start:3024 stop:3359 length:336 start_codon:yes stop_codon:yes gene_type:complete
MKPFEQRARQIPAPYIQNKDGSKSTHLMAAEVNDEGNWHVFPTIQPDNNGKLHKMGLREAQAQAIRQGNYKDFGKDKDAALRYSEGEYKRGTPMDSSIEKQRRIAKLLRSE